VLDRLREVVFETDPLGNWSYLNHAWTEIFGFDVESTLGTNFLEYVHPEEREETITQFVNVISGGASYCHHETRYRTAAGDYRWVELRAALLFDDRGNLVGNAGTILDITDRRRAQELLADQNRTLELIAQDAPLTETLGALAGLIRRQTGAVVTVETPPGHERVGPRAGGGLRSGRHAETPHGVPGTEAPLAHAGRRSETIVPIASTAADIELGRFVLRHDADLLLEGGERRILERSARLAALAIEQRRAKDQIRYQALHDALTGLPNRTLMGDRLRHALDVGRRTGHAVALLLLDLDHFKIINDTLGHESGDRVLRRIAGRLRGCLRATDTVCRLGGDEFAVVLPELSAARDAELVCRKVLEEVKTPVEIDDVLLRLEASAGIALFPEHGDDPDGLLRRADVAMYRAKRIGGGCRTYESAVDEERLHRSGLAGELRQAIESEGLSLHYQPKIDLRSGRVVAVEGLVRWHHPERGDIPPDRFIPLARTPGSSSRCPAGCCATRSSRAACGGWAGAGWGSRSTSRRCYSTTPGCTTPLSRRWKRPASRLRCSSSRSPRARSWRTPRTRSRRSAGLARRV
jgi:diguanylate cyclase (GGDEF)-like protein/PAS domain S-box-containing protein